MLNENNIISKLVQYLFFLGIFFIPFNSYEGIVYFGEFKSESAALFLLVGFVVVLVNDLTVRQKLYFPYQSPLIQWMFVFLLWLALTVVLNFDTVQHAFLKKTTGVSRFFRQYFALILSSICFTYLYWSVMRRLPLQVLFRYIRTTFLCALCVVSVYAFFEILYLKMGVAAAYQVLRLFDYLPFVEFDVDTTLRISSICFEPPSLGTFLIMTAGWMFSYAHNSQHRLRYVPGMLIVLLTYYSGSRTALLVVLFQLLVYVFIHIDRRIFVRVALKGLALGTVLLLCAYVAFNDTAAYRDVKRKVESLDFMGNLTKNYSNKSRFGIQIANFEVFLEHPIIGVGFGQQAYHAVFHYPLWAKKDNYEFKLMYLNHAYPSFPPGYNMYIRLLAETGIIGLGIFVLILYKMAGRLRLFLKTPHMKSLASVLLVSFAGYVLNWFQGDMFRVFGFWITLMMVVKMEQDYSQHKITTPSNKDH